MDLATWLWMKSGFADERINKNFHKQMTAGVPISLPSTHLSSP
jgi:hypothetical protein